MDTNIGKTVTARMIARVLARAGKKVITQKMIQIGCEHVLEDIEAHRQIRGLPLTDKDTQGPTYPYILTYPYSPHMTTAKNRRRTDLDTIIQTTRRLRETYEYVLLEGAGELMVSNGMESLTVDYVKEQAYPLILVTSGKLGNISHALLSPYACERYGIEVKAIVYNQYPDVDLLIEVNTSEYLKARFPGVPLILLPEIRKGSEELPDIRPLL